MMIDKRLMNTVSDSKKYIRNNVLLQWISLMANIVMMLTIAYVIEVAYCKQLTSSILISSACLAFLVIGIRFVCAIGASKMSYLSSKTIKAVLRNKIYTKLLRLGSNYHEQVKTAEVVQVAVEGVEQLEHYFGSYLPQLFYSMLAPLTLFIVFSFMSVKVAIILFICVPLIPIAIALVQTFAKKILRKYWGQYTTLGDHFLENVQGLTTLKVYQADAYQSEKMMEESLLFRKVTMRVLNMQLNSVTIMDFIAYGGAALGIVVSLIQFQSHAISMSQCIAMILLSVEFFIPMRLLGSFFHVAMNGIAASDKIFALLDLKEDIINDIIPFPSNHTIQLQDVSFFYQEKKALRNISVILPCQQVVAIVGESGSGKSTLASLLMGQRKGYIGNITIGNQPLSSISDNEILSNITYVGFQSYLLQGTIEDTLLMANRHANEKEMWEVLKKVRLDDFVCSQEGLQTRLSEKGDNLSGGQKQRLALARAMLHDTPIYLFDEATSNIDAESENIIVEEMYRLAKQKTVIFITHRLKSAQRANQIIVLKEGKLVEVGIHEALLENKQEYASLWETQSALEKYTKE